MAPLEDLKVMSLIHEDVCCNHSRGGFPQKALNLSYYWRTMHQVAKKLVQRCNNCHRTSSADKPLLIHVVSNQHGGTNAAYYWGRDMMIVVTDYFTKCVEAEPRDGHREIYLEEHLLLI